MRRREQKEKADSLQRPIKTAAIGASSVKRAAIVNESMRKSTAASSGMYINGFWEENIEWHETTFFETLIKLSSFYTMNNFIENNFNYNNLK